MCIYHTTSIIASITYQTSLHIHVSSLRRICSPHEKKSYDILDNNFRVLSALIYINGKLNTPVSVPHRDPTPLFISTQGVSWDMQVIFKQDMSTEGLALGLWFLFLRANWVIRQAILDPIYILGCSHHARIDNSLQWLFCFIWYIQSCEIL